MNIGYEGIQISKNTTEHNSLFSNYRNFRHKYFTRLYLCKKKCTHFTQIGEQQHRTHDVARQVVDSK